MLKKFHLYPYVLSDKGETIKLAIPVTDEWIFGNHEDGKNDEKTNKIKVDGRSMIALWDFLC